MCTRQWSYHWTMWTMCGIGIIREKNQELQYLQNKALRTVYKVKLGKNPRLNTIMLHNESRCSSPSDRRYMQLLSFAHTLTKNVHLVDNRNLPTRRNQGIRLKAIRSLKPIVIRSAIYRAISRWNTH